MNWGVTVRKLNPYLDKIAEEGIRFTRNYSGNAVCAPSRCVLMTGKHPGHAFIRNNGELKPEGQRPIPMNEVTMAEIFKKEGYVTGAFGKWGLGGPGTEGDPMNQGFDRFYGYNCQRHAHSYYPNYLWSDRDRVPLANNPPVPGMLHCLKVPILQILKVMKCLRARITHQTGLTSRLWSLLLRIRINPSFCITPRLSLMSPFMYLMRN